MTYLDSRTYAEVVMGVKANPLPPQKKAGGKGSCAVRVFRETVSTKENSSTGKKISRRVIPAERNLAASVTQWKDLEEGLQHHAYLRIQLFFVGALAFWKKACRTKNPPAGITLRVEKATLQVGQAHKPGFQAAHVHAASGLVDNLKENIIGRIEKEGITPIKAKILRDKGLTEEELLELQQNHQESSFVKAVIDKAWPQTLFLQGTDLELQMNATNTLPLAVNQCCDKKLEKEIRPLIVSLYTQVMRDELEPIAATKIYVQAVRKHFEEQIYIIEEKLKENQTLHLKTMLSYYLHLLMGTKEPDYSLLLPEKPVARKLF